MNAQEKLNIITERLTNTFTPVSLQVLDESDQHRGHAGHGGGGRHFAIVISAQYFADKSRVQAHRSIYALFNDLIPQEIHALKIKII
jgi:BolA protein